MSDTEDIIRLGPEIFAKDAKGTLQTRIGTIFLRTPGLITIRGIHAMQRLAFIDALNKRRAAQGLPKLTQKEEEAEIAESVDLLFDENYALIRPDPDNMPVAIRGDEFLQKFVSKRKIRYLNIQNRQVRDALRTRGEAWRMAPVPRFEEEIRALIKNAHVGIDGRAIYYYNHLTGTRFLTLGAFRSLGALPAEELRTLLEEIHLNAGRANRFANPEIDSLPHGALPAELRQGIDFAAMDGPTLRATYQRLLAAFESAVDDPCLREVSAVIEGLSPEYFMQIEWLPGGRVEEGELFFDPVFMEADRHPEDEALQHLCDPRARAILFNYVREYSQIEYVNIGRTRRSLSQRKGQGPRALVYIVELKERHRPRPQVKIIRIQRWTVATHLAAGRPLLQAIIDAEDYTDYVMDRRLGARQLGMHLPPLMVPRTFREIVKTPDGSAQSVQTGYFERDYISGFATNKIPENFYASPAFRQGLCRLLGQAAAPNIIVGRAAVEGGRTIFDDGDEVILLNAFQLPDRLILAEPTGSFVNYKRPYGETIADYAAAMNRRKHLFPDFKLAARIFVDSFEDELARIQRLYRERRDGFDGLFRDRPLDENGSISWRWKCVLKRLDAVNAHALACQLMDCIDL